MMKMATMTTAEVAIEFDTTPRTLRKFLRDDAKSRDSLTPGKGARYSIEKRDLKSMRTRFTKWVDARTPSTDDAPIDDASNA